MRFRSACHRLDHAVQPVELGVQHGTHQLGGAGAVAGEGLLAVVAALPVEVAGIDGAAGPLGDLRVGRGDAAALAAGDVLEVVEAEGAGMADGAELPALVGAADALAGVLDDDEVAPGRDGHDRVHVAGRTPHVDRDDGAGARADRLLDRLRIDGDALVDVDDHRDGAHRQHRRRRRHVGVGRHQHLVAGSEPDADHRRRQAEGAAGGQREVAGPQPVGVAPLEALALAVGAVAEQGAGADHLGDGVDLFLPGDVHGSIPPCASAGAASGT